MRELRQHASKYLARVALGETLEVTDRGRPVARLVPVSADPWKDLLASGRVVQPEGEADLLEEPPRDYGVDASAQLARIREEQR